MSIPQGMKKEACYRIKKGCSNRSIPFVMYVLINGNDLQIGALNKIQEFHLTGNRNVPL